MRLRPSSPKTQLSLAGFGASFLIGNGNGNGLTECSHTARRVCRQPRDSVILAGFSPNSHESCPPMEIQPILNTIKDLTERSESIRGYL